MYRVVCPVCKAGFEARFSRENCAINCVTCGVAFNASSFLPKSDPSRKNFSDKLDTRDRYTGPVLVDRNRNALNLNDKTGTAGIPAGTFGNDSTHTGGLPFSALDMVDESLSTNRPRNTPEPDPLPVLPKGQAARNNAAPINGGAQQPAKSSAGAGTAEQSNPVLKSIPPVLKPGPVFKSENRSNNSAPAKGLPEMIGVPTPAQPRLAPPPPLIGDIDIEPLVRPVVAEPARMKKSTRRPLLEGSFGKYDIEGEIARGGVGAVFRARERTTGKPFALKVLIEGDDVGETERERFRHECETAKALSLPGMVQIHEVGEHEGRPYMAMELVEGKSLDKVISERTLTVNACLVLMKSVAGTVGALHEKGYVHRDIKPGNILLDQFDTPKVADFGLVKSLDEVTRLTASGLVCGTPAYMSPEQARGEGKNVDPRSDVWALGAVLYEMLAGEPPFKADNALKLMLRITKEQPRKLTLANRKVPVDVEAIVMKCLDKNPARRYANARALAADIATFLEGGKLEVSTQSKVRQLFDTASANRARLVPATAAMVALLVIGIVAHTIFATHDAGPLVEEGIQALKENPQGDETKLKSAERDFREAIALDPQYARAWLGLGAALARRGIDQNTHRTLNAKLVDDAFKANEWAAKLDPKLQTDALANAAYYNRWLARYVVEASLWEHVVRNDPASLKYRESLAMAYWHAGVEARKAKYYQLALTEFKAILASKPDYPNAADHIRNIERNFLIQPNSGVVGMNTH